MTGKLKAKPTTRRDAEDKVRLKTAGIPAHINPREDDYLKRVLPEAAGKVIKSGLLAEAGRRGDDRVTQLTREERLALKRRGGSGTRNPASGLLEYNTAGGGGGEGGDNGVGGPGNGSAGTGPGQGPGPGDAGYGSDYGGYGGVGFGFSNYSAPEDGLSYSDISNFGGIGQRGSGSIGRGGEMDNFASYAGAMTDAGIESGYAPLDTWGRLLQNMVFGPPPAIARGVPGRYGAPNAKGPGVVGTMVTNLSGPYMSAMMGVGKNMGQSMSKEAQEASAREMGERGAMNSPGTEQRHSVQEMDARIAALSKPAGTASGAETAKRPQVPPGYTQNPAGQIIPLPGNNRSALRDPIQNLLYDYLLRGRQGSGFGW